MIQALRITLERAEGYVWECEKVTVSSWSAADVVLARWALTAPKPGHGYHKCDFDVLFADGLQYQGRYDLTLEGLHSLAGHIRDFQTYWAQHETELNCAASAREFLETYSLKD